ncbi:DUF1109 domain-containing protein [Acidovorax sp. SUPP1855]|uniref:DUF1109 domain-containing protein n=1 Tax=unclassified Acidovorax TaxID=2684926 RepID=UPI0023DE2DAD|nr:MULTISPECIES: DUF1109 domain-containing protein [unclassified Acidovorax]GKS85359.1 DUF1109 domain-containing protein [Acidovorax sp. SUPP1855]GKT00852.1 DUF1109 domain-containing protein [Acidovorax sp. SUPP3434]
MKTDDLIHLLAADTVPVPRHAAAKRLALGLLLAVPVSGWLMRYGLGLNPALGQYATLPMFWVKFGAPLLMALAALRLVARLGKPGSVTRVAWLGWAAPIGLVWALGLMAVWQAPAAQLPELVLSRTWRVCAENIAMLSLPVFLAAIWVLRGMAPVRPAWAGAGAGALGGAVGATVYALHCPELAAPFIAIWYVLGMSLPVAAGAVLGPRLLRW